MEKRQDSESIPEWKLGSDMTNGVKIKYETN